MLKIQNDRLPLNTSVNIIGAQSEIGEGLVVGQMEDEKTLVRLQINSITKKGERLLKSYKCLTPHARLSRLYLFKLGEIEATNHGKLKKGQTAKSNKQKS